MLALKMKLALVAEGIMPMPGATREEAKGQLTEEGKAQLSAEILGQWANDLKGSGFQMDDSSSVTVELVEV